MKILPQPWAPQTERDILQLNRWQFQRPKYYDMHARDLPTLKEDDVVHTKQFQQESKEWEKKHDIVETQRKIIYGGNTQWRHLEKKPLPP